MSDYKEQAQAICGDAEAVRKLLVEIHELKRTRTEAEAVAEVKGHRSGIAEMERRLSALHLSMPSAA